MGEGPLDFNLLLTTDEADVFDSTSLKPRTNKVGSFFRGNIMWHAHCIPCVSGVLDVQGVKSNNCPWFEYSVSIVGNCVSWFNY